MSIANNGSNSTDSVEAAAQAAALRGAFHTAPAPAAQSSPAGQKAERERKWPASHEHNLLTRRRDAQGNRLPGQIVLSVPVARAVLLEQAPALKRAIELIAERKPIHGNWLASEWDEKLQVAIERLALVRREEEDKLVERNALAKRRNGEIDAKRTALESARDEATAPDRARLLALDEPLAAAHEQAARRVSATGGKYDPANPLDDGCILRHERRPIHTLAAGIGQPMPDEARVHLAVWLGWVLVAVTGALVGLSLGIITHVLYPDTIARHWPVSLACAVVGFGIASGMKYGVRKLWYLTGQYCVFGRPLHRWSSAMATAIAGSLTLLAADLATEQQGLLALMRSQMGLQGLVHRGAPAGHAAAAPPADPAVFWFVALLISLGLIVCAAAEGYLYGRQHAVTTLLLHQQESEYQAVDASRRANPAVQGALEAIAHVVEILRRQGELKTRIEQTAAPFEERIAALETQRLPEDQEMSLEAMRRIEDAADNVQNVQLGIDAWLWRLMEELEPSPRWWQRLFLPRAPKPRLTRTLPRASK